MALGIISRIIQPRLRRLARGQDVGAGSRTGLAAAISLALVAMPASAVADRDHHPTPDPRPLWRVYPLGSRPLAKSTETSPIATGTKEDSTPIARSAKGDTLPIGFAQALAGTALLCMLVAIVPIAVRRGRPRSPRVAAGVTGATTRPASNSKVMAREKLIDPLRSARRELIDPQPARPTHSSATREEAILRCAATYAAASQRGDRAPMAAVRAIVPPTTKDPAACAKRIIAEARRRGLLTSHGRGKAQGELTPKALDLMERAGDEADRDSSPRRRSTPGVRSHAAAALPLASREPPNATRPITLALGRR